MRYFLRVHCAFCEQPRQRFWESDNSEPSPENYIRMATLADDTNCLWFWEQASVYVDRMAARIHNQEIPQDLKSRFVARSQDRSRFMHKLMS